MAVSRRRRTRVRVRNEGVHRRYGHRKLSYPLFLKAGVGINLLKRHRSGSIYFEIVDVFSVLFFVSAGRFGDTCWLSLPRNRTEDGAGGKKMRDSDFPGMRRVIATTKQEHTMKSLVVSNTVHCASTSEVSVDWTQSAIEN